MTRPNGVVEGPSLTDDPNSFRPSPHLAIRIISLDSYYPPTIPHLPGLALLRSIDAYRNPHVYTKSTLTRAAGENQYALGRMLGLEVGQAANT